MSIEAPARRIRRSPEAARENIMAAAERLLVEKGPQALKLVDVAQAAGVSHATVLHHFTSIDGVQAALMERMIRELVARILDAPRPEAPQARMEAGASALFDAFEKDGGAKLAAWLELTGETKRLTNVKQAVQEVIAGRLADEGVDPQTAEDMILVSISLAMGVGLFGASLAELLGRAPGTTRQVAFDFLRAGMAALRRETTGGA